MIFSKCIGKCKRTQIIEYRLFENKIDNYKTHSYTIKKYNIRDDKIDSVVCKNIKSKNAIVLIWNDIIDGIQY